MKKILFFFLLITLSLSIDAQPWIDAANVKHRIDTTYVTGKNNLKPGTFGANPIRHVSEDSTLRSLVDMVINTHKYDSANFGSGFNFANHDLSATGSRFHDIGGYNMIFSHFGIVSFVNVDTSFNVALDTGANMSVYGIHNNKILGVTDTGTKGSVWITGYRMPVGDGAAGSVPVTNGAGTVSWSNGPQKPIDTVVFSKTGPVVLATYTPLITGQFDVSGAVNITAISTDVLGYQVAWTDENSASQTERLLGAHAGNFTSSFSGANHYAIPAYTIIAKQGFPIIVSVILAVGGGTTTFDAGVKITH